MREIRDAMPADIDGLRDIFRRSSLSNEGDRATLLVHPEAIEFDPACVHENRTRVALADGRVVGFATTDFRGDAFELDDLFVDPDSMRRGIGLELIRDVEALARRHGVLRVEVTANDHARAFYERAGFVLDGIEPTEFGPGTRMHLDVSPTA